MARDAGLDRPTQTAEMIESERRTQFQRQIYRKWQPGDVYSPQDLSGAEQKKWRYGRKKPQSDAFDVLGINPILEYKVRRDRGFDGPRLTDAELHNHVRVHDRHGPDKALQGHGSAAQEPAQDRKGHTESHRAWSYA
jgi:hypothetical protein